MNISKRYDPKGGFTRIENRLLEALGRIRINGETAQVLMVIIRFTLGYNTLATDIATSQFTDLTGLHNRSVKRALSKLIGMRIIEKLPVEPGRTNRYQINLDTNSWEGSAISHNGIITHHHTVQNSATYQSHFCTTLYKEDTFKEKGRDELTEEEHQKNCQLFRALIAERFHDDNNDD